MIKRTLRYVSRLVIPETWPEVIIDGLGWGGLLFILWLHLTGVV